MAFAFQVSNDFLFYSFFESGFLSVRLCLSSYVELFVFREKNSEHIYDCFLGLYVLDFLFLYFVCLPTACI